MQSKTTVKVSFNDETKRFKITSNFKELVDLSMKSFDNLQENLKFYYLDEDMEIISVSCDEDLAEVIESEQLTIVKLLIANSQAEARQALT